MQQITIGFQVSLILAFILSVFYRVCVVIGRSYRKINPLDIMAKDETDSQKGFALIAMCSISLFVIIFLLYIIGQVSMNAINYWVAKGLK